MSLKRVILAMTLGFTFLVHAQDKKIEKQFDFKCVTEMPTTSFWFAEDGDSFNVRIMHHNGTQFAPFMQRLIVPNDMAKLLEDAEVAKNTGSDIMVRFNKKNCTIRDSEIFSCVGGGESLTSAKKQIKPWHIGRTNVTQATAHGDFKKTTITMSYEIQGQSYEYLMDYQPGECKFEEEL